MTDIFYYRGAKCETCREPVPIFGLGHYTKMESGEDLYSKMMMGFYKYGYKFDYFLQRLLSLLAKRNDLKFDAICVCPTSRKGEFNEHMVNLAKRVSEETGIPFREVVTRVRDTEKQHSLKNKEDRKRNVAGSCGIAESVDGKTILILDNASATGSTLEEVHEVLKKNGAKAVFVCLGLSSLAKESDFDLNPNLTWKFSKIIVDFHWPKVPKEKRQKRAGTD